jgi:hypothetical protein
MHFEYFLIQQMNVYQLYYPNLIDIKIRRIHNTTLHQIFYQTLKYHVKLLEEQNIDPNLFSSLKENSELHTQKIHLLENKINSLEHEIPANRFISEPLNSNSNFNPAGFLTPELHFDSDVVEMSPFTL